METKRTVKKTTKKASVNMSNSGKKVAKATVLTGAALAGAGIKKTGAKGIIVALLCFIIGFGAGLGGYLMLCKNDCFEILGGDDIVLTLDESYEERGVKIVEFGKDISSQVKIEMEKDLKDMLEANDNKSTQVGTYYIKYTVDSIKYGKIFKIEKIRLVTFVEPSEASETLEANGGEA